MKGVSNVQPTDTQIVFTAFTDDPMTVATLVRRTGLTALRINNALDSLVDIGKIHIMSSTTWALKKKGNTNMTNVPTPPQPPTKATASKKAPAAKKAAAPKAPKAPKEKKESVKHSEVAARDEQALALITKSKSGMTKQDLATALDIEAGHAHMCIYRLNRDGKIVKTKGEGRQALWIAAS